VRVELRVQTPAYSELRPRRALLNYLGGMAQGRQTRPRSYSHYFRHRPQD